MTPDARTPDPIDRFELELLLQPLVPDRTTPVSADWADLAERRHRVAHRSLPPTPPPAAGRAVVLTTFGESVPGPGTSDAADDELVCPPGWDLRAPTNVGPDGSLYRKTWLAHGEWAWLRVRSLDATTGILANDARHSTHRVGDVVRFALDPSGHARADPGAVEGR